MVRGHFGVCGHSRYDKNMLKLPCRVLFMLKRSVEVFQHLRFADVFEYRLMNPASEFGRWIFWYGDILAFMGT